MSAPLDEKIDSLEQVRRGRGPLQRFGLGYRQLFAYWGPALITSMAYMDPGNYGTDIQAGASFRYGLLWTVWMANLMAMLLQYLSGKLGIAAGKDLSELVRQSLDSRFDVLLNWVGAEAAAAATDL